MSDRRQNPSPPRAGNDKRCLARFDHWNSVHWNLFGISDFDIRIFPRAVLILCCFWLLAAATAGCSLHRSSVEKDLAQPPESFQRKLEEAAEPEEKWWRLFGDPKLNDLMLAMFDGNLDLEEAYARWRRFQAEYAVTDSARRLSIDLGASASRTRTPTAAGPARQNQFDLSAASRYEVDLWGKLKARSQAALWEVLAGEGDVRALYISLAAQTADLYYTVIEQKSQLLLLDQTIESFRNALDLVESKYQQGLVSVLDVYQAQENLASAIAEQPVFQQQLAVAEHALSLLLGRYPQEGIAGEREELPEPPPPLPVGVPATVLKLRPDVQASILRLQAADARIGAAMADRFPTFDIGPGIGYTAAEVADLFQPSTLFWRLVGELAQPLLDGGRRKAEIERQRAFYEELLSQYRSNVLIALQEVEDAMVRNRTTEERVRRLEDLVVASQNALDVAIERYLQGLVDYLTVLTQQQQFYRARRNLLSAQKEILSSRIELARALGGTWPEKYFKGKGDWERRDEAEPPPQFPLVVPIKEKL